MKNSFLFLVLLFLNLVYTLFGQEELIRVPGKPVIHYFPDSSQRKAPLSYFKNRALLTQKQQAEKGNLKQLTTATYNPFVLRFATPPSSDVLAVFNKATEIWSQFIVSGVPIVIDVSWSNLGGNILGSAGPTYSYINFDVAPYTNTYFPISLMEKMRAMDANSDKADIVANFNSSFSHWYIGTEGLPSPNQIDLLSVVIHELGHGLGFSGYLEANSSSQVAYINYPGIFDKFTQDGAGISILNTTTYPNNSNALYQLITGGNLYQSSPSILAENNQTRSKLYAPSTYSSGSSVYHVDQNTYPVGDSNALMTPFIAYGEVTRELGPIVKGLFKEMGWAKAGIYPQRMKDVEPNLSGYLFRARACYSNYYGDSVSSVKLFISVNKGQSYTQVSPNQLGDEYTYTLSYQSGISEVRYYWTAKDANNNVLRYPAKANTYDYFLIQADTTPPSVTVQSDIPYLFASQTHQKFPVVSASDYTGIQKVEAIYKINASGVQQSLVYSPSVNTANTYLANLNLSGLLKGDTLYYKIKGTDKANSPNAAYYPASGWIAVPVLGGKTALNAFGQRFENIISTDFFMKGFSVQTPLGFDSKSMNTAHPYNDGIDFSYDGELGIDTYSYSDLILLRPIIIQAGEGQMTFDEIALVEPGAEGAPFYDVGKQVNRNFFDYVIVQGSKDGGNTWVDLSAGWDATADANWLSTWNASIDNNGNSAGVGALSLLKTRSLSLTQNAGFVAGDQILLRFRMLADQASYGWGWLIDNVKIQGSTQTIAALEPANNLPVIQSDKIYISNSTAAGTQINLTVSDADNDNLTYQVQSGGALLGFGSRGKLTLLVDPNSLSDLSNVQIKVDDGTGSITKTLGIVYCESSTTVNKNASNVTKIYSSNSSIQSTQKITGSSKIVYNATNSISLQPGFIAEKGVVFTVQPGVGCPGQ